MAAIPSASVRRADGSDSELHYEKFADEFLDHAEDGFFNAYYDRLGREPRRFLALRLVPDPRSA